MVCILIEMYTGELFYETREDIEHLALIEKQCGAIPDWMARSTQSSHLYNIFLPHGQTKNNMRIDWPSVQRKDGSQQRFVKMKTLSDLVQHKHNRSHWLFLQLLEFMMVVDPNHRPSAKMCLEHEFFKVKISESDN